MEIEAQIDSSFKKIKDMLDACLNALNVEYHNNIKVSELFLQQLELIDEALKRGISEGEASALKAYLDNIKRSFLKMVFNFKSLFSTLSTRFQQLSDETEKTRINFINLKDSYSAKIFQLNENIQTKERELQELKAELNKLKNENSELVSRIKRLEEEMGRLNSLNIQLKNQLEESLSKLKVMEKDNDVLRGKLDDYHTRFSKLDSLVAKLCEKLKNIPDEINLPSKIVCRNISGDENKVFTLIENLINLSDLDSSLVEEFKNKVFFKKTFQSSSYVDILKNIFAGMRDVEEKDYIKVKNTLMEEKAWISDNQVQRYLHTELFQPYVETAESFIESRQLHLIKAATDILKCGRKIRDSSEVKKTLIRRTGIRLIDVRSCKLSYLSVPLDGDALQPGVEKYLNELKRRVKDASKTIDVKFFEAWIKVIEEINANQDKPSKFAVYALTRVTLNLLGEALKPKSELRKLFNKSLVLI
ncbi:MAG: hypothetical protein ACTSSJ_01140 [Candidatus Odinarchaeia archaeon]